MNAISVGYLSYNVCESVTMDNGYDPGRLQVSKQKRGYIQVLIKLQLSSWQYHQIQNYKLDKHENAKL